MSISEFNIGEDGFLPLLIGMSRYEIDVVLGELPEADKAGLNGEEAFRWLCQTNGAADSGRG